MPTAPGGHAAVRLSGEPESDAEETAPSTESLTAPVANPAAALDPMAHAAPTARPLPLGAAGPSPNRPRATLPYASSRARGVEDSEAHVEAALEASSRAEASLSALLKTIHQVTTGVSGAREANEVLVAELQSVREMLRSSHDRRSALERRIALVEQERDSARRSFEDLRSSSAADRTFLMEEQDRFLQAVMEEHEQTVGDLIRERDESREQAARVTSGLIGIQGRHSAPTNPNLPAPSADAQQALAEARRTIERLVAERDRARDVLRKLQAQRDEAQDAVDRLTAEVEETREELARNLEERANLVTGSERANPDGKRTDPVPAIMDRPTFPAPPQQVDAAVAASRANTPPMPLIVPSADAPVRSSVTPPPEELRSALFSSDPPRDEDWEPTPSDHAARQAPSQPPPAAEENRATPLPKLPDDDGPQITIKRPPLKPKPDPASHSLGGYSMAGDGIESDRIDTAKIRASKPPVK
jgi:predicted nuclease with TOPRIM domain